MLPAPPTPPVLDTLAVLTAAALLASWVRAWMGFVAQAVDRQERAPWSRERMAALAREAVLRMLFTVLAVLRIGAPSRLDARGPTPVLLVPDPAWGPASLVFLSRFLRAHGMNPVCVRWDPEDRPVSERADELDRALVELARATGTPQVDVVAVGAGGVAAGWVARHPDGAARIRRLIAIAVPWRGTRMAVFRRDSGARELRTDSLALDGLLPLGVPAVCVWTPDDPEIIPASSAVADPQLAIGVEGCGHLGLLLSARAFRAVHAALTGPLVSAEAA